MHERDIARNGALVGGQTAGYHDGEALRKMAADQPPGEVRLVSSGAFAGFRPVADAFRSPHDAGCHLTAEDRAAIARLKDAITLRNAAAATMNNAEQAVGAAVDEMRRLGFEGDDIDRLSFSGRVFHDLKMPAELRKVVTFRAEG